MLNGATIEEKAKRYRGRRKDFYTLTDFAPRVFTVENPANAGSWAILSEVTLNSASSQTFNSSGCVSQPDAARLLALYGVTSACMAGSARVSGTDVLGNPVYEDLMISHTGSTPTTKAFKTVNFITIPSGSGGIAVGTLNKFGLPDQIENAGMIIRSSLNSGSGTEGYTLTGGSSCSVSETVVGPSTTPNGSNSYLYAYYKLEA